MTNDDNQHLSNSCHNLVLLGDEEPCLNLAAPSCSQTRVETHDYLAETQREEDSASGNSNVDDGPAREVGREASLFDPSSESRCLEDPNSDMISATRAAVLALSAVQRHTEGVANSLETELTQH